jgi:hypothetical protein
LPDVKISPAGIVVALAVILMAGIFAWLTFGPKPPPPAPPVLTSDAREYLSNLVLDNVHMQASESMTDQRLVEILGTIINRGGRTVKLAEVTCVFHDYNNREVARERVPIVSGPPLHTGQSRAFRLPFDDLPDTWNQQMPALVIAQIQFE